MTTVHRYENSLGYFANANLCVSEAMKKDLAVSMGVRWEGGGGEGRRGREGKEGKKAAKVSSACRSLLAMDPVSN